MKGEDGAGYIGSDGARGTSARMARGVHRLGWRAGYISSDGVRGTSAPASRREALSLPALPEFSYSA